MNKKLTCESVERSKGQAPKDLENCISFKNLHMFDELYESLKSNFEQNSKNCNHITMNSLVKVIVSQLSEEKFDQFLDFLSQIIANEKNHTNVNDDETEKDSNEQFNEPLIPNRKKFSQEEDELLKKIVSKSGPKNWKSIASLMTNRTSRQCRDRYHNYLAPGFNRSDWNEEEDKLLADKYLEFGPKWTSLKIFFNNRTANDIKNRYNYTVSKKYNKKNQNSNENKEKYHDDFTIDDDIDLEQFDMFDQSVFNNEW